MRCFVVADDLTGAMDAAGPLAARGLNTWMVASPDECDPAQLAGADVLSINTESRHLGAEAARARIDDIAQRFMSAPAQILFKKIDSTLRGNVVAETLALLDTSGRSIAVVAPAFPALGRTVRGGVVYVGGIPLPETPFARDALSPAPSAPLPELFNDNRVVVADAVTDDDLRAIARQYAEEASDVLFVGSGGLSAALADVYFPKGQMSAALPLGRPMLFAVGSRAVQSAAQIAALKHHAPDAIVLQAPSSEGGAPEQIAAQLADSVALALAQQKFGAVVATGGDTASAILRRLNCPALRVHGELLPGIPYGRIGDLVVVTKAGGFGAPDAFLQIAQKFAPATR